jgi:hypothetical protein
MRKKTYEEIKHYIEVESDSGCHLLTNEDEYIDTHAPIRLKCNCGNEFMSSYHVFKSAKKYQCNQCSLINCAAKQIMDGNIVLQLFIDCDYSPQFTKDYYLRTKQRLPYICNNHIDKGVQFITYNNLKQGGRCPYCQLDHQRESRRCGYKAIVESKGFQFVNFEFVKNTAYFIIKCPLHLDKGVQRIAYCDFMKRTGCKYCGREKQQVKRKKNTDDVVQTFVNKNYTYCEDNIYVNNITSLNYICNKHPELGVQITNYANVRVNTTCKQCIKDLISREKHYLWKGGVSSLYTYMRDKIECWKIDSLKHYNYKCVLTGKKKDIIVHHLYSYRNILLEVLKDLNLKIHPQISDYSELELKNIEQHLIEKHYYYGLGVPLHSSLHTLFHSIYLRGDNTLEQFEEFKLNYIEGRYKDMMKEVG